MQKGDHIVERGAALLRELSAKLRSHGGFAAQLAPLLAEDAAFLRKLRPSLVFARVRGETPLATPSPPTGAPPAMPSPAKKKGGVSPYVVAGAALVAGIAVAKLVDWRGHAHPRD